MLGGLEKVKAACKELETRMGTSEADEPGFEQARRPVVFRAYRIENDWFGNGKTVDQLESYFISQGKRLFVERMRHGSSIVNDIIPGQLLQKGDEVVLSGRREFAIGGSTPCHDTQKAIFQPKIGLHTPSKLYAWSQYTPYQTGRY